MTSTRTESVWVKDKDKDKDPAHGTGDGARRSAEAGGRRACGVRPHYTCALYLSRLSTQHNKYMIKLS